MMVTEVEVIGRGIVEVHRALDEPESQDSGVEVEIPLRVAGYSGDVMNTGSAETHRPDSCLVFLRDLALVGARPWRATPAVAPSCRGLNTLFLLSYGCHNTSNPYPSIKATDMPFAEALM